MDEVIRDRIQDKLNITFSPDASYSEKETVQTGSEGSDRDETDDSGIETTDEEVQAYMIIRAIAAKLVPLERVTLRDSKSYCAIIMDDNNRRPICRLYFNSAKSKSVGFFDAQKNETKHKISDLNEIYAHAKLIEAAIEAYA